MASRLELHEELVDILGSRSVYFQPPESKKLSYPCIIYNLADISQRFADDRHYKDRDHYELTVVDQNPDSTIHRDILEHFRFARFNRWYCSDNLNHFNISVYY